MIIKMREIIKGKHGQKGFTLIELIVVMAILAVLAAIAVPKYAGILDDSKVKVDAANVKMLQNAVDVYYAQHNSYPGTLDSLTSASLIKAVPLQESSSGAAFTYASGTGTVTE